VLHTCVCETGKTSSDEASTSVVADADASAEPHPVLPQPLRLVSKTGSGTKQASLVADDVADMDEVKDP
jgi:hypothetical protein